MTRRISAILGKHSGAGQDCTRHFSVPPLKYKNLTSYKKYRPEFGLNIQESYGKRPIKVAPRFSGVNFVSLNFIDYVSMALCMGDNRVGDTSDLLDLPQEVGLGRRGSF